MSYLTDQLAQEGCDPAALALGLLNWNNNPNANPTNAATLATQTIFALAIWLPAGVRVSNVWLPFNVAKSATTPPTGAFVGFGTGAAIQIQSGNLNAHASWGAGTNWQILPIGAQYVTPLPNYYYVYLLVNGTWTGGAGTQPTIVRGSTPAGLSMNNVFQVATAGTGQTALPANGAAVTLATSGSPIGYCVGVN